MKILVFGGTGAMGKPVVEILAERGHDLYVTSRTNRKSYRNNVTFIQCNAMDIHSIEPLMDTEYDAIIDFMIYTPEEFNRRVDIYLSQTRQYVFISSARVYANTDNKPITESSPRLLDETDDSEYLKTNEYALVKAKEENLLNNNKKKNYTIIRPYITYNDERLQLGVFEKETWLQRALDGKKIVFSRDIADRYTTLTYGNDVALRIADLIGDENAFGEVYHITTDSAVKWMDVLNLYVRILEEYLGYKPEVCMTDCCDPFTETNNHYQVYYDRRYNRIFDNSKIQNDTHETEQFIEPLKGLEICLKNFLSGPMHFGEKNWRREAVLDKISGDKANIFKINGLKNKVKYILFRYIY